MSKREDPGNCQPDSSMSNDAENSTNYYKTLRIFFPFMHLEKFLSFLLISVMPASASGEEAGREQLLCSALLADSLSKGAACLSSEYCRYLRTVVQGPAGERARGSELSEAIMQSLVPQAGAAAVKSFRAALEYKAGKGMPRDLKRRTGEIREQFLKGMRVYELSICPGGTKVMLPAANGLQFMDEWIRSHNGLAAALCAACRELFAFIGSALPELLRRYRKEKLPFCSSADAVDKAIEWLSGRKLVGGHKLAVMCAIDRIGIHTDGGSAGRKDSGKKAKADLSSEKVLRCALQSRLDTARGIIALDVLLTSRDLKKQSGRKIKNTGCPVRDLLGESVCAREYVRGTVLGDDPTLYELLLRVNGMMIDVLGYGIPGSFASQAVESLEQSGLADVHLADFLEPMRLKGKPDKETVAQMKAALTDEYITGLEDAVKVIVGKLRSGVKKGNKSSSRDDRGNDHK